MEISNYITEDILKKFKVFNPVTLFPPTPAELIIYLKKGKCPICLHKLYIDRKGNGRCKQADKFFIKAETLKKYI
jgi:hypothetical protein